MGDDEIRHIIRNDLKILLSFRYINNRLEKFIFFSTQYLKFLKIDDLMHTYRVTDSAIKIAEIENGDLDIVFMGAILHDIGKIYGNPNLKHTVTGVTIANKILNKIFCTENEKKIINECILKHRIKDLSSKSKVLEVQIIQDADLLDEIGMIGILKCAIYHAKKGDPIYFPNSLLRTPNNEPEMIKKSSSIIDHFYDKLLILDRKMNTVTGKELARKRIIIMKEFLKNFKPESGLGKTKKI